MGRRLFDRAHDLHAHVGRLSAIIAATALALAACSERPKIAGELLPADLILPPHPPPERPVLPDGQSVRVATLNIHGGNDATPEEIGAFLAAQSLDFVGLQECPRELAIQIAAAAGFEHVEGDGQALLAHNSIRDFEKVDLETRSYVHATSAVDGVEFSIYVAHIGWNAEGDRQCRLFVDHLANDTNPYVIVAGDFNDEHYSSQNDILETVLADAFTTARIYPGDRISWPATEFDGSEGSQLIDLVFFRPELGVIVRSAEVFNLSPVLSDHKPVVVELLFPRDPQRPFREDPYAEARDPARGFREDTNLLANPGAEDGLSGWTVTGNAAAEEMRGVQSPKSGARLFTGPSDISTEDPATSSGTQIVDLSAESAVIDSGRGLLFAAGDAATAYPTDIQGDIVSNRPRPYDDGELVIEVLDGADRALVEHSTGRRDMLAWHRTHAVIEVPPGARRARFSWIAHRKIASGGGSDAVFDDLYLGFGSGAHHAEIGAELIENGGAEDLALAPWTGDWRVLRDQESLGLMLYPPWTYSGAACFVLGASIDGPHDQPISGDLVQKIDLAAHAGEIDAGRFAIRWGALVRTYDATAEIRLSLEIVDKDGTVWGTIDVAPVSAAEWTKVESLTAIPAGATAVNIVASASVSPGEWAFADGFFARPEKREEPR